jgi:hypothetical protein
VSHWWTSTTPGTSIRSRLTAAERQVIEAADSYKGSPLTDQEVALGIEQAKALGELPA